MVDLSRLTTYVASFAAADMAPEGKEGMLVAVGTVSAFAGAFVATRYLDKVTLGVVRYSVAALMLVIGVALALASSANVHLPSIAGIGRWCDLSLMNGYILVFVGGGLGAALRHGVNRAASAYLGVGFPFGTLFVNVLGAFLMGVLVELFLARGDFSQESRLFFTTGVLGGFTTFSAFSLEAALMWQRGDFWVLAAYTAGSVILSVAALFLGMGAIRAIA